MKFQKNNRARVSGNITAVIIHCGESTFQKSLESVQKQSIPVPIKVVKDVHPLPKALDKALEICDTEWLVTIDADTILYRHALMTLMKPISPDIGAIIGKLRDRVYGVIGGVRLINAKILKEHGFRHPWDNPYPDRKAINFLEGLGLRRIILEEIVGEHNPYNTPFEAFRRFFGTYRKRGPVEQNAEFHFKAIINFAKRSGDFELAYFMMAGLICAALVDTSSPRDYIKDEQLYFFFEKISKFYKKSERKTFIFPTLQNMLWRIRCRLKKQ